jgi:hypothetical protein
MAGKSKPGKIHLRIVEVMKKFPGGISGGQIRQELEKEGLEPGDQTHLDRRKRDLKKWFVIEKDLATIVAGGSNRKVTLHRYVPEPSFTQPWANRHSVRARSHLQAFPGAF